MYINQLKTRRTYENRSRNTRKNDLVHFGKNSYQAKIGS